MDIKEHLESLNSLSRGSLLAPISSICTDSRKVQPGSVFVALKGRTTDGHKYLDSAIQKQAQVLVIENKDVLKNTEFKGLVCVVPSTRKTLPLLLKTFYNSPSEKMFCVGITGTNGKTTVAHITSFLFSKCGWRTGTIGTIKNNFEDEQEKSQLTTPEPVELYRLLSNFFEKGAQATVMEVSSIGLDQQRVSGVDFNLGVFTNLSEEHLDYHQDMPSYFKAKKNFFKEATRFSSVNKKNFLSILNLDSSYGQALARELQAPYVSYGLDGARFSWEVLSSNLAGSRFNLLFNNKKIETYLPIPGLYNIQNAVAALACAHSAGFSLEEACKFLKELPPCPGRMQKVVVKGSNLQAFVDYAHTPDALRVTLAFLKQNQQEGSRLITVFGCGGGRDKQKRPQMLEVAEEFSDQVILTSDNPREEDPQQIIADCLQAQKPTQKTSVELDREKAIQQAVEQAGSKDVILVAGKGHESHQQIRGQRLVDFDDVQKLSFYLKRAGK